MPCNPFSCFDVDCCQPAKCPSAVRYEHHGAEGRRGKELEHTMKWNPYDELPVQPAGCQVRSNVPVVKPNPSESCFIEDGGGKKSCNLNWFPVRKHRQW